MTTTNRPVVRIAPNNQVFGLPYTIVRPSALYGERCVSRRVGQAFIENALRGRPGGMGGRNSTTMVPACLAKLRRGQQMPELVASGTTGTSRWLYSAAGPGW